MANIQNMGGYSPHEHNRKLDSSIVNTYYNKFGRSPDQVKGPNFGIARLANALVGEIDHIERPDDYICQGGNIASLPQDLREKKLVLANITNQTQAALRQQALRRQKQVSQADMDELNILLNSSAAPVQQESLQELRINQNESFNFDKEPIEQPVNRYIQEQNSQDGFKQFELPLFNGNSDGLSLADRAFIRDEFNLIKEQIVEIKKEQAELKDIIIKIWNTIDMYYNQFAPSLQSEDEVMPVEIETPNTINDEGKISVTPTKEENQYLIFDDE